MPANIKMNINNLNYSIKQIKQIKHAMSQEMVNPPSSLNSSMIGRIFKTKPGCGSCGK